jgi:general secretion pathway protein M
MRTRLDFKARWAMLHERERTWLKRGGSVVALALLWWVMLAPAIMTVRNAAQQHRRLDAQLQRMQILQAQVPALHQRPQVNTADAARALDQSVRQLLGVSAQLQITGAQATVSIENLRADTLAQWLTQARLNAYATVTQAQLKRNAAASPATWSGKLTLGLPER